MRFAVSSFCLLLVLSVPAQTASGQYDWSVHFGPQETGFEKFWFGQYDLELLTLRGVLDWESYSLPQASKFSQVSKITRIGYRVDLSTGTERRVHSSFTLLDESGLETATVYLDPQTKKTTQRELFTYDDVGRLTEWRPVKDPADAPNASTARSLYPGALPFGSVQRFDYYSNGTLREWVACSSISDGADNCDEAYLRFDQNGRIVAFVWLNNKYDLTRNAEGNLVRVDVSNRVTGASQSIEFLYDETLISEHYSDQGERENIAFKDTEGRVLQYRVPSASESLQYSTTTWIYDTLGRLESIQKGLDHYAVKRDADGRVVKVKQSVSPKLMERSYNKRGELIEQKPALTYNRYDLAEKARETLSYTGSGLLEFVRVADSGGRPIGRLEVSYDYRDADRTR